MAYEIKRRPKSLSYSALQLFESDEEEFFLKKLAPTRVESLPQADFMSVGSAFDAYEKADLHTACFGPGYDPQYEFEALFEDQVEPHNRDFARAAGLHVFGCYKQSGAHDDLLKLLLKSIEPPRFESKVEGLIDGVPWLGKPDLRFMLQFPDFDPIRIVLDWKVKGYCSKHGASPSQGFMLCRDGYDAIALGLNATKACPQGKQSGSHNTEHKKYMAFNHRGLTINQAYMEQTTPDYADQISSYGWLLGEPIGDENVVAWIDEIICKYMGGAPPLMRVATHRARVSQHHQFKLRDRIKACWASIESGHVFSGMSREDSDARCETLERTAVGLKTDGSAEEDWFNQVVRSTSFKR